MVSAPSLKSRTSELEAFYKTHAPGDGLDKVPDLAANALVDFESVRASIKAKYGAVPEGWQALGAGGADAQTKKLSLNSFLQSEDAMIHSALAAPVRFDAVASTISETNARGHKNLVREQKTAHFKAGHIGEKIHEDRGSHLSDLRSEFDADMDIVFDAGLGLALNNQMEVTVSVKQHFLFSFLL
jgi:hypothetical protein